MLIFFERKSKSGANCKAAQRNNGMIFNNCAHVKMLTYNLQKTTIQRYQQVYVNKKKMNLLTIWQILNHASLTLNF